MSDDNVKPMTPSTAPEDTGEVNEVVTLVGQLLRQEVDELDLDGYKIQIFINDPNPHGITIGTITVDPTDQDAPYQHDVARLLHQQYHLTAERHLGLLSTIFCSIGYMCGNHVRLRAANVALRPDIDLTFKRWKDNVVLTFTLGDNNTITLVAVPYLLR